MAVNNHRGGERMLELCFLGLDGFAAEMVFADENSGRWPNIEQLAHGGLYGASECEADHMFTGPSWTSIYTGQPAAVHGLIDLWGRPLTGAKTFRTVKEPYIWDLLNDNGLVCGVIAMPITYPARRINGYMIAGFPSPTLSVTGGVGVPDDFVVDHSQVIRQSQKISGVGYSFHDRYALDEDLEMLRRSELRKAEVVADLLKQRPVDALFVQYSCLDRVGHELNNYARRGIPYHHERILEMYDWLDVVLLPQLLSIRARHLIIVSDHGWQSLDVPMDCVGRGTAKVWGMHHPLGVFMFLGPDVPADTRVDCRNIDVLPTIMEALALPVPDVGGRSVLIRQSELDEIDKHLAALGYIEDHGER